MLTNLRKYKWHFTAVIVVILIMLLLIHNHRLTKDNDRSKSVFFDVMYYTDGQRGIANRLGSKFKDLIPKLEEVGNTARMHKTARNSLYYYFRSDYWYSSASADAGSNTQFSLSIEHKTKYRGNKKVEQELRRVCKVINDMIVHDFAQHIKEVKVRYSVWEYSNHPKYKDTGVGAAKMVREKALYRDELEDVCNYMDWLYSEENEAQPL